MSQDLVEYPNPRIFKHYKRMEPVCRDSTTRRTYKRCPREYFLSVVLGFKLKSRPEDQRPLDFGSRYHHFRDVLFKTGGDVIQALVEACENWPGDPQLGSRYDFLTLDRLKKSCMKAYGKAKTEQVTVLSSEQHFDVLLKDGKTRHGGVADQFAQIDLNKEPIGRDFKASSKTWSYWSKRTGPNDQMTGYIWALGKLSGRLVKKLIIEVLHNSRKEGPKIWDFTVERTPKQLERWEEEQIHWEKHIAIDREADLWPMADDVDRNCSFCHFRQVCSQSNEVTMSGVLDQYYEQRPHDFRKLGFREDNFLREQSKLDKLADSQPKMTIKEDQVVKAPWDK